jgi:hypothetical protein
MEDHIKGITDSMSLSASSGTTMLCPYLGHLNALIDGLDQLLIAEGLITESAELV